MHLTRGKANVIIDGQWGSTGKGKLAGYLALRNDIQVVTSDFQSNAGHTWVSDEGQAYVLNHLPMGFLNKDAVLCIGPAATITVDQLMRELDLLSDFDVRERLLIHPNAGIVQRQDVEKEQSETFFIASTMKGVGAARARKIMRTATLAKDIPELSRYIGDTTLGVHAALKLGKTVMCETAQGFDLSLNHGHLYPHTTSRDVTTASALNNIGVAPPYLGRVWGCLRTFPIRVGPVERGDQVFDSGPFYSDQEELTWEGLSTIAGQTIKPEKTTVTQRERRIFTWSRKQFLRFCAYCAPTDLFVNFVNYLSPENEGVQIAVNLAKETEGFMCQLQMQCAEAFTPHPPALRLLGTGAKDSDMVEL